jgi:hypothetical protein
MAKAKFTLVDLSGTIGGLTFVRTRNGDFARAKRGTYTSVECNDSLKVQSSRTTLINDAAKLVHDLIKFYVKGFKKSNLWQEMLSLVRTSAANDLLSMLKPLEGLEAHGKYKISSINPGAVVNVTYVNGIMTMELMCSQEPHFPLPDEPDCYYYELVVLFIDAAKCPMKTERMNTGWLNTKEPKLRFEMAFETPAEWKYYVVLLKAQAGCNEQEIADFRAMGMRVMKVGEFEI